MQNSRKTAFLAFQAVWFSDKVAGDLGHVRFYERKDMSRSYSDISVQARSEPRHVISLYIKQYWNQTATYMKLL